VKQTIYIEDNKMENCTYCNPCGDCKVCLDSLSPNHFRSETNSPDDATSYRRLKFSGDLLVYPSDGVPEVPPLCGTRSEDVRGREVSLPRVAGLSSGSAIKFCAQEGERGREGVNGGVKCFRYVKEEKRKRRLHARATRHPREKKENERPVERGSTSGKNSYSNMFQPLADLSSCSRSEKFRAQALRLAEHLSLELGLPTDTSKLRDEIQCGELRKAVREMMPDELNEIQELSVKTCMKVERSVCKYCEPRFAEKVNEWRDFLSQPVRIDDGHLETFRKAFRSNIPRKWNTRPGPFIPNGNASLLHSVKNGGNWNEEQFSDRCRTALVFSKGKPRIVTCYSSYNTEVLTPLHTSLYSFLGDMGWLLVGDPTEEHVLQLNGLGAFNSFDYTAATDSIKKAYVQAAIEELIEAAEDIGYEEARCLRVLGNLRLYDLETELLGAEYPEGFQDFNRGQPMGSVMSFPLLCLINKTCVDMALTDLYLSGRISFKEWSEHRCKINGDDLLVREPKERSDLRSAIIRNGQEIGLTVNEEKSMVSQELAEINSTLFSSGGKMKEKKTNASAIYMKPDTEDVLGLAFEASRTVSGFRSVVRANAKLLSLQQEKHLEKLPYPFIAMCRKDKKIRKALLSAPSGTKTQIDNLFPVVEKPLGYDLERNVEISILGAEVKRLRSRGIALNIRKSEEKRKKKKMFIAVPCQRSWRSLLRRSAPKKEMILSVLEKKYWSTIKESGLRDIDVFDPHVDDWFSFHDESLFGSKIEMLIASLKSCGISSKLRTPKVEDWSQDDWLPLVDF